MEDLLGQMWIEREMPERPKESFLTGLFGGGVRNVDREELCELLRDTNKYSSLTTR